MSHEGFSNSKSKKLKTRAKDSLHPLTMKVAAVLLLALATAHAKLPPAPRFAAKQTLKTTAVTSSPATLAALQVRGGGMVPGDAYVKFFVATSVIYGLQCLLMPGSMTTMHYEAQSSQITEFWLRGMSVMMFTAAFLMTQVDTELATKVGVIANIAISVLLPWNGKFKWIAGGPGAATKPIHLFPELLLLVQTATGLLAL